MNEIPNRCRLVLVANMAVVSEEAIGNALAGGDVASLILYAGDDTQADIDGYCKTLVSLAHGHDLAVLIADDTQVFGRSGADGMLAEREKPQLADLIARFSPQNIVGCGNIKSRHQALQAGELKPDFLFFGKLGGDIRPEPHRKNLGLAEWWSELVQIPAIVMGGNEQASIVECANTGAEFAALEQAVFLHPDGPGEAVRQANALLDEHAPEFDDEDEA